MKDKNGRIHPIDVENQVFIFLRMKMPLLTSVHSGQALKIFEK